MGSKKTGGQKSRDTLPLNQLWSGQKWNVMSLINLLYCIIHFKIGDYYFNVREGVMQQWWDVTINQYILSLALLSLCKV